MGLVATLQSSELKIHFAAMLAVSRRLLRGTPRVAGTIGTFERQYAQPAAQDTETSETSAEVLLDTAGVDPHTIVAVTREASGTSAAERLRQTGKTPAILFSLPGNASQMLALDSRDITKLVKRHGRQPFHCQIFNLEVESGNGAGMQSYRVVPRLLHVNAATDMVENVTFMHMPPERRAIFAVPVQVTGEDMSPGVKRGGWVNLVQRTVQVSCCGDAVLPHIEVDVSSMDLGGKLDLSQLAAMLPEGAQLLAEDMKHPVVKIGGRGNR